MNQHKQPVTDTHIESDSGFSFEKLFSTISSGQNFPLVLLGVAVGVGIIIAATTIWVKSGDPGIEHTSQNIDLLNKRVELLDDNINKLEATLSRLQILADSIKDIENAQVSADQQYVSEIAAATAAVDTMEPVVTGLAPSAKGDDVFAPVYTVKTKLNLRPSPSLNTTPIAILSPGTRVEKISEKGDWFHVNTDTQGQGWCFSDYLSPL